MSEHTKQKETHPLETLNLVLQISYLFLPGFDIQAPGPSASVGRILQFR